MLILSLHSLPKGNESFFSRVVFSWQGKSPQNFRAWEVELIHDITTAAVMCGPENSKRLKEHETWALPMRCLQPSKTTWAKPGLNSIHMCTMISTLTHQRAELLACIG